MRSACTIWTRDASMGITDGALGLEWVCFWGVYSWLHTVPIGRMRTQLEWILSGVTEDAFKHNQPEDVLWP